MRHSSTFFLRFASTMLYLLTITTAVANAADQTMRVGRHSGYGRISLEWQDNITFIQTKEPGKIILRFSRSVSTDMSAAVADMSNYVSQITMTSSNNQVLILLHKDVIANAWQVNSKTVAIDFNVGKNTPAEMTTRVGQHDDFYRIVLDWHDPVHFAVSKNKSALTVQFDRNSAIDTKVIEHNLPRSVKKVTAGSDGDRSWLRLQLVEGASADVSSYGDRGRVVIDVRTARPEKPPAAAPEPPVLVAREPNEGNPVAMALPGTPPVAADLGHWPGQLFAALSQAEVIIDQFLDLLDRIRTVVFGAFEGPYEEPGLSAWPTFRGGVVYRPTADSEALVPGAILDLRRERPGAEPGGPDLAISYSADSLSDPPTMLASRAGPTGQRGLEASEREPVRPDVLDTITAGQEVPGGQVPTPSAEDPSGVPNTSSEKENDTTDPELRALNRVLVEAGGLLLPTWGVEIAPEILYEYSGSFGLLFIEGADGQTAMAQQVQHDSLELATTFRVGLPWDSQAEVRVPYEFRWEEASVAGQQNDQRDGNGLGDIEVALSHQFLREGPWWPDVLGEVRWKTDTGQDSFEVGADGMATGTGFNAISGAVTAVKSYDPLVFFGKVGYLANLPAKKQGLDIDPGDSILLSLGTVLSTGPGTSLKFGISEAFTDDVEVDGQTIHGTNQVVGMLNFGVAAALPNRVLLDISAGVGITEDAPDFALRASLPYRF